ncbi:hypothetical protein CAP36_01570 [Chitinophagaceae bacterium IBVUCB2]|nr:hypothetical protein CAP36_01570 [Chitinophagaceae bacterium IBVUCB2]
MIRINKFTILSLFVAGIVLTSCDKNDDNESTFDTSGTFTQNDQMARPAVNTVFVGAARKNEFNTTIPSAMNAAFNAQFQSVLTGFGYTQNALGQDKAAFTSLLVTDVLNVKMNGTTTFFDGVPANTLSGRALADDVIDVELILIFGGPNALTGSPTNPGLIRDNVNTNDKAFLPAFPFLAAPF